MTSADVHGKFLWHELLTTDPGAASAFYSKVLGWKSQAWEKDPTYSVWSNPKGPVGGLMKLPPESAANGGTPHWIAYVGVRDLDATSAAAQRLGGRVVKAPTQIPDGGRYALLTDPQNGLIGVYAPAASGASGSDIDEFAWHELATPDHAAAFRFYRELFGWEQLAVHDMGPMGPYLIFGRHGQRVGGMFNRPASMASSWPHWLVYAKVPSAVKTAEAAAAAGGRVVNGPHQVPDGTWIAQLTDPQGAAIAVNQTQPVATAAPKPAAPAPALKPAAPKPAAAPPPRPAAAPAAPRPAVAPAAPRPAIAPAPRPAPAPAKPVPTAAERPATFTPPAKPAEAPKAPPKAVSAPAAAPKRAKAKTKKAAKKAASKPRKAAKKAKKAAKRAKKTAGRRKAKAGAARKSSRRKVAVKRSARKVARKRKSKRSARRGRR
jgi:uncharacterized protein